MLKMMYKLSSIEENVNMYRPEMMLRTGPNVKMKIAFTDKERVRQSPYYLCISCGISWIVQYNYRKQK